LDGKHQKVQQLHRGFGTLYRIIPSNGREWSANYGHVLTVTYEGELWDVPLAFYLELNTEFKSLLKLPRIVPGGRQVHFRFTVLPAGRANYYGFTLDGDGRYLLEDFTVTHNSGKSLTYVGNALITQDRTLVLTSTKALQEQLLGDFQNIGMVDLRGRANYKCRMSPNMNCEQGKAAGCADSKTTVCPHRCALEVAKKSQLVVTNYACWMANNLFGEGLGKFDALVLDEAHSAPDEICSMVGVELTTEEVYSTLGTEFPETEEADDWKVWAGPLALQADSHRDMLAQIIATSGGASLHATREYQHWANLTRKLSLVASMVGPWVVEPSRRGYQLNPLWPSQYAERALFVGIPKIYAYSATVNPKTMHMMGVAPDELESFQYASSFPPRRSPVYRIPTCKVDRHMDNGSRKLWLGRIDQILAKRLDRKGILHCVSYQRSEEIMAASAYRNYMVRHTSADTAETIEWFKASRPPMILVSPAVTTGYDFPGSECEFSIVAKLPFPDSRSKIMKARSKEDPLYIPHLTIQTLQQETGRGMRFPEDQNESWILDDHITWMLAMHRSEFLEWWLKLYHRRDLIPDPPPPLNGKGY